MGNVWQITQVSLHPAYQEGCFASLEKGFQAYLSRQNDVVNVHDIVLLSFRYFHPPPLPSPTFIHTVLRFSRFNLFLSLFIFSSFLFAYVVPFIVLCRRSRSNGWNLIDLRDPRALLVTRQQAFSFLRGRNRFFVMGRNGSRDPRV